MFKKCLTFALFALLFCGTGAALAQNVVNGFQQQISIQGRFFYKDGRPWLPKGVDVNAFVKPPRFFSFDKSAQLQRSYWGARELAAVREKFGADTLRLHISQGGFDPQAHLYDPVYVSQVLEPVNYARKSGFNVILVMDAQQDGTPDLKCMPSPSTLRAWATLTPKLPNDQGIMLELFNEPCLKMDAQEDWGHSMQRLIETVRESGSRHILLLDGLKFAHTTTGLFPRVHDTIPNHLALAVHPYLNSQYISEKQWQDNFGNDAARYPMIATEWNATSVDDCIGSQTPAIALSLIRYLESLHIGLIEFGIESTRGWIVKDRDRYEPTDYKSFENCNDGSLSGGGQLLAHYPND